MAKEVHQVEIQVKATGAEQAEAKVRKAVNAANGYGGGNSSAVGPRKPVAPRLNYGPHFMGGTVLPAPWAPNADLKKLEKQIRSGSLLADPKLGVSKKHRDDVLRQYRLEALKARAGGRRADAIYLSARSQGFSSKEARDVVNSFYQKQAEDAHFAAQREEHRQSVAEQRRQEKLHRQQSREQLRAQAAAKREAERALRQGIARVNAGKRMRIDSLRQPGATEAMLQEADRIEAELRGGYYEDRDEFVDSRARGRATKERQKEQTRIERERSKQARKEKNAIRSQAVKFYRSEGLGEYADRIQAGLVPDSELGSIEDYIALTEANRQDRIAKRENRKAERATARRHREEERAARQERQSREKDRREELRREKRAKADSDRQHKDTVQLTKSVLGLSKGFGAFARLGIGGAAISAVSSVGSQVKEGISTAAGENVNKANWAATHGISPRKAAGMAQAAQKYGVSEKGFMSFAGGLSSQLAMSNIQKTDLVKNAAFWGIDIFGKNGKAIDVVSLMGKYGNKLKTLNKTDRLQFMQMNGIDENMAQFLMSFGVSDWQLTSETRKMWDINDPQARKSRNVKSSQAWAKAHEDQMFAEGKWVQGLLMKLSRAVGGPEFIGRTDKFSGDLQNSYERIQAAAQGMPKIESFINANGPTGETKGIVINLGGQKLEFTGTTSQEIMTEVTQRIGPEIARVIVGELTKAGIN